jgi:hypothetical protein
MPQRRLIQIDSSALSVHLWQRGALREELRLTTTPDDLDALTEHLGRHRSSLFSFIADVPDEGFVSETIPFVRGADRQAMLGRKLSQLYYGSPLSATISLGRETGGRRDERVLFLALTRPQFFEPWLAAARLAESQVAGVYTMPLVAGRIVERLGVKAERLLLVTIGRAGIRQTFFEGNQLRFSRLTPVPLNNARDVAQACGTESLKLQQYLISQRVVPRSAPLPAIVLVHAASYGTFAESCRSTEELRFDLVDIGNAARACGLKEAPPSFIADPLYLHLLAQRPPETQLAPAAERRYYNLWQMRSALTAAGALTLIGCSLFAAKQVVDGHEMREDTAFAASRAQADRASYQGLMQGLPPLPASLEGVRGVVNRYGELKRRTDTPERLLGDISRALDLSPEIELESIDWSLTTAPDQVGASGDTRRAPGVAEAPAANGQMYSTALIAGTLNPANNLDQRGQLESINAFVANLRRNESLQVAVLQQPVDFQSGKALKGGTDTEIAREAPRFLVRVSTRLSG